MALIAFDLAPNAPNLEYITLPEPQYSYDLQLPMQLTTTDSFSHFMLPIQNLVDFAVPNTESEQVSILKINLEQRLSDPYREDIGE